MQRQTKVRIDRDYEQHVTPAPHIGSDAIQAKPLEIKVTGNFEEASRRFKTLVQAEGIIAEFKQRQTYEKPTEKKRRKRREAKEHRMMLAAREKMIASGEWDRKQKRKEQKRLEKIQARKTKADTCQS